MSAAVADRVRMFSLLSGTWLAQSCYAIVKLGIPDLLADGPQTAGELAARTDSDERALGRVLRALASAGVLAPSGQDAYELTGMGELLRTGVPRSSRHAALMYGEEVFRSFAEIGYTLRTGKPAFESVYGQSFYEYLDDHPDAARTFASAMGDGGVPVALATCELTGLRTIVDIGGGSGGLLARVLLAQPQARGVLVDLPRAIEQARERLAAAGVADRVEFVAGSFFDGVPTGADVYVLARVLHNWDDADALRLLAAVRAAIPADGRLLVFEGLIDAAAGGAADSRLPASHVMDLLIMLMLPGCDRTLAEYADLLTQARFDIRAVRSGPLRASQSESVIEAVPR